MHNTKVTTLKFHHHHHSLRSTSPTGDYKPLFSFALLPGSGKPTHIGRPRFLTFLYDVPGSRESHQYNHAGKSSFLRTWEYCRSVEFISNNRII